jgi:hypothetical protein
MSNTETTTASAKSSLAPETDPPVVVTPGAISWLRKAGEGSKLLVTGAIS